MRNFEEIITDFWERVDVRSENECWKWKGYKDQYGYGRMKIDYKHYRAHRLAWMFTHGPIPKGLSVLHRCDHPSCTNPAHLFLGTNKENMEDMANKNRSTRGERNYHAKLTEDDVKSIRIYLQMGYHQTKIAKLFGVTSSMISCIALGKNWKWLE